MSYPGDNLRRERAGDRAAAGASDHRIRLLSSRFEQLHRDHVMEESLFQIQWQIARLQEFGQTPVRERVTRQRIAHGAGIVRGGGCIILTAGSRGFGQEQ